MLVSPKQIQTITTQSLYSGTRGWQTAKVLIVGEAWGATEAKKGQPFAGFSGKELESMLAEAGIDHKRCLYTNLINKQPFGNQFPQFLLPIDRKMKSGGIRGDGICPNAELTAGLQRLDALIDFVKPKLIIACGNWPLWWLTGKANVKTEKGYKVATGIDTWRGSQLFLPESPFRKVHGIPVLPVYHPAAILRQITWRKITVQDFRRAQRFLSGKMKTWSDPNTSRKLLTYPTADQVEEVISSWLTTPTEPTVCDLETKSQRIHIVGLSRDGRTCMAIPFFHITPDGHRPAYSMSDFCRIYMALYRLFSHPQTVLRGQNFMYDLQYITRYFHCTPKVDHDSMVAQIVLFPILRKALDYMASMYCEHYVYWKDDLKESSDTFDTPLACLYNCEDLWRTHEVISVQQKILPAMKVEAQFHRRMRVFPVLVDMMNRGVNVDQYLRNRQKVELMEYGQQIGQFLEECMADSVRKAAAGKTLTPWYNSPSQLATILYDLLKLKPVIDKGTGARTTNKEALAKLSDLYPHYSGMFSAIIILRSLGVIAGNILSAPLDHDGRMRTSYNLAGPITLRLASSENVWGGGGNLQNILRDREPMDILHQNIV